MAAFTYTDSYLNALIANSADAQSNLYLLNFTVGNAANGDFKTLAQNSSDFQVRTESFDWTPPSQDQYEVKFLTAKINRPKAFVKVTHNFSFNIRIDANYEVYKALLAQQKITFNPYLHWALNDINKVDGKLFDLRVDIITGPVTSGNVAQDNVKSLVGFEGCWITAIDPIAFKTGDANPVKVKVSCSFKKLWDKWYQSEADNTTANWLGVEKKNEEKKEKGN